MSRASVRLDRLILGARLTVVGDGSASVSSMHNTDAGRLTLSAVDLTNCSFYGAHDLESLRLEPTVILPRAPGWWRTRRNCIADEFRWRAKNSVWRGKDWMIRDETRDGAEGDQSSVQHITLSAGQVSGVYRELRKGLEAQSNEPGAADFYYGEMEMRRQDRHTNMPERLILTGYWLISGYGLRALRALASLTALFLIGAVLMSRWGLASPGSTQGDAILASAQSLVPGVNVAATLTNTGRWISLLLRILGPILIAFAALALRNRVRR